MWENYGTFTFCYYVFDLGTKIFKKSPCIPTFLYFIFAYDHDYRILFRFWDIKFLVQNYVFFCITKKYWIFSFFHCGPVLKSKNSKKDTKLLTFLRIILSILILPSFRSFLVKRRGFCDIWSINEEKFYRLKKFRKIWGRGCRIQRLPPPPMHLSIFHPVFLYRWNV